MEVKSAGIQTISNENESDYERILIRIDNLSVEMGCVVRDVC